MNEIEQNMKRLVDGCFLFQDYRNCLQYMKYPISDFKNIKAFNSVASCQEIQFLAQLIADPGIIENRDFETIMQQAFQSYKKGRNVYGEVRNCLFLSEMLCGSKLSVSLTPSP